MSWLGSALLAAGIVLALLGAAMGAPAGLHRQIGRRQKQAGALWRRRGRGTIVGASAVAAVVSSATGTVSVRHPVPDGLEPRVDYLIREVDALHAEQVGSGAGSRPSRPLSPQRSPTCGRRSRAGVTISRHN